MDENLDKEIQELLAWLDQWLAKWRRLQKHYEATPKPEDRKGIRKRIKALEEELLGSEMGRKQ